MNARDVPVPCQVAPDGWFREEQAHIAKAVCRTCPLLRSCAEWGIRHERHGVWGGLDEYDRERIRDRRRIVLDAPTMTVPRQYRLAAS